MSTIPQQLPLGVRLRSDAVFGNFETGANGELLAALQSADVSPLWIWGAPGTGKTHLLQAVCAGRTAAYLPLSRSLALPPEALAGFERTSVVCVDDVDAVAGDEEFERALFRLFNDCADLQTRLIYAASRAPRHAEWALHDWRSRAAACVVYQLHELDDAGRLRALTVRAAQRGLQLPAETGEYLLRRVPRDLPSLFKLLDTLDEASLVAQRRLTIPFIRDALERRAGTEP
jgi:DnaA family protein